MPTVTLTKGTIRDLSKTNLWCPADMEVSIMCSRRGTPIYITINGIKYRVQKVENRNVKSNRKLLID